MKLMQITVFDIIYYVKLHFCTLYHYCCVAICFCAVIVTTVGVVPDDAIGGNGVRAPVISGGSLLVLFLALAAGTNPRSPGV